MKPKKLLIINILTLLTFILVVGFGIYQTNANRDDLGREEEQEIQDDVLEQTEEVKKEPQEDTVAIKEKTPTKSVKRETIGSLALQDKARFLAENDEDELAENEVEDDSVEAENTVNTQPVSEPNRSTSYGEISKSTEADDKPKSTGNEANQTSNPTNKNNDEIEKDREEEKETTPKQPNNPPETEEPEEEEKSEKPKEPAEPEEPEEGTTEPEPKPEEEKEPTNPKDKNE